MEIYDITLAFVLTASEHVFAAMWDGHGEPPAVWFNPIYGESLSHALHAGLTLDFTARRRQTNLIICRFNNLHDTPDPSARRATGPPEVPSNPTWLYAIVRGDHTAYVGQVNSNTLAPLIVSYPF